MLRGWRILLTLVSVWLVPVTGQAVSLGDARVQSSMMQPLRAEIALGIDDLAAPQDLKLGLASRKVLERLAIPYDRLLPQLRFRMREDRSGRWFAVVTTRDPVREPFLSFALRATWPGGEIVREYSLLLDPPNLVRAPAPSPAPAERRDSGASAAGSEYGPVQPGETLWPIAQKVKPAGVSTNKMMMALLRANPHAFRGGNINNLRTGVRLRIPSAAEIASYSERQARAEVADQMAVWRDGGTPRARSPATGQDAGTPKEPDAASESTDETASDSTAEAIGERLEIVTDVDSVKEPLRKELLLTLEQVEADRLRSEALRGRVEKLESEMNYLQRLLVLKERQIATLQQIAVTKNALDQAQSDGAPKPPASKAATPAPAQPSSPASKSAAAGASQSAAPPVAAAVPSTNDFERQLLVYAVIALAVIVVLLAILLLRRGSGSRAGDYTLADHPSLANARPYADQVRRMEEEPKAPQPPPPPPSRSQAAVPPPPPPPPSAGQMSNGEDAEITDDDLAAWAKDLDDELEVPKPVQGAKPVAGAADDGSRSAADPDLDLDIPSLILDIDEELQSAGVSEQSSILELASAYLEIGDLDGARELLEKIIADAKDPSEVAEARALLTQIGAD